MFRQVNQQKLKRHKDYQGKPLFLGLFVSAAFTAFTTSRRGLLAGAAVGGILASLQGFYYANKRLEAIKSIPQFNGNILNPDQRRMIPPITKAQMSDITPDDLEDDQDYYVGFCFKRGFADIIEKFMAKSPLRHSSMIFVRKEVMDTLVTLPLDERETFLEQEKVIIFGRQSPVFRGSNPPTLFQWIFGRDEPQRFNTLIDNEQHYILFATAPFESVMSNVLLSGKEIKEIIAVVNKIICQGDDQFCNMFTSNCYSASVSMLAQTVIVIHNRYQEAIEAAKQGRAINPDDSKNAYKNLQDICELMFEALSHNKGQGVINNEAVINQVKIADRIARKFDVYQSERMLSVSMEINEILAQREPITEQELNIQFRFKQ